MSRCIPLLLVLALSAGCGAAAPAGESGDVPGAPAAPAAPALAGRSTAGGEFSLGDRADRPTVLLFVRGSFCPVCLQRLQAASEFAPAYGEAGARVVAVTLDPPDLAHTTAERLHLGLPLVSVDAATFRRWGVWPADRSMPRPGDFVLDPQGRIRWSRLGEDAADRASDVALLGILDSLHTAGALARR